MKTILVSGASGIVGYGILRSLMKQRSDIRLIGTSIYKDSPAAYFCDIFERAIPTNDKGYIDWLISIINKYDVDLIIPGIEADVYKWSENILEIEKTATRVLLNNSELISLCRDKWTFYQKLNSNSSSFAIETTKENDFTLLSNKFGLPFLLKPRNGFASKGIVKIYNEDDFIKYKKEIGSVLIAQPIIGNDDNEYTTSAFCDGKGGFFAHMTLKRKLSKDGYTEIAEVSELFDIDNILSELCSIFKPFGPTNFQFRKQNEQLKLLEINPRISSSTSIRAKFGYNESLLSLEYFLEQKKISQPPIQKGKAVRYIEDLIIYE